MTETPPPYAASCKPPIPPSLIDLIVAYIAAGKWGSLEILFKAGKPVMVKTTETVELSDKVA